MGPYVGLVLIAVLLQEVARLGVWRFHRCTAACPGAAHGALVCLIRALQLPLRCSALAVCHKSLAHMQPPPPPSRLSLRVLDAIARREGDAPLSAPDRLGLALTHGLAHGCTHSAFFFAAWLPLVLGDGTLYNDRCPAMSFFLVGALSTLGMAGARNALYLPVARCTAVDAGEVSIQFG